MSDTYDIFNDLADDGPIWIEAVQGLENARARLLKLLEAHPGNYFLFDPMAAKVIASAIRSEQMQVPVMSADRSHHS